MLDIFAGGAAAIRIHNMQIEWILCRSGKRIMQHILVCCLAHKIVNIWVIRFMHFQWRLFSVHHRLFGIHVCRNTLWESKLLFCSKHRNQWLIFNRKNSCSASEKYRNILHHKMNECTIRKVYKSQTQLSGACVSSKFPYWIVQAELDCLL